jgi:hypothetical protein
MSQSEATGPRSPATAHSLRLTQRLSQVESVPPRLPAQPTAVSRHIAPLRDRRIVRSQQSVIRHCGKKFHRSDALSHCSSGARRRRAPRSATTATSISRRIRRNCENPRYQLGAADLGNNTAPTRFPSAAAIPAHSTIQCPPSRHPTYPSAHPARAGVRSESSLSAASLRRHSPPPLSAAVFCRRSPPPLFTASLRRRSPPSLSAASLHRRSPPPLFAAALHRLSPPPLSAAALRRRSPPPLYAVSQLRVRVRSCGVLCACACVLACAFVQFLVCVRACVTFVQFLVCVCVCVFALSCERVRVRSF